MLLVILVSEVWEQNILHIQTLFQNAIGHSCVRVLGAEHFTHSDLVSECYWSFLCQRFGSRTFYTFRPCFRMLLVILVSEVWEQNILHIQTLFQNAIGHSCVRGLGAEHFTHSDLVSECYWSFLCQRFGSRTFYTFRPCFRMLLVILVSEFWEQNILHIQTLFQNAIGHSCVRVLGAEHFTHSDLVSECYWSFLCQSFGSRT